MRPRETTAERRADAPPSRIRRPCSTPRPDSSRPARARRRRCGGASARPATGRELVEGAIARLTRPPAISTTRPSPGPGSSPAIAPAPAASARCVPSCAARASPTRTWTDGRWTRARRRPRDDAVGERATRHRPGPPTRRAAARLLARRGATLLREPDPRRRRGEGVRAARPQRLRPRRVRGGRDGVARRGGARPARVGDQTAPPDARTSPPRSADRRFALAGTPIEAPFSQFDDRDPGRARSVRRRACRRGPDRPPNAPWWEPKPFMGRPRVPDRPRGPRTWQEGRAIVGDPSRRGREPPLLRTGPFDPPGPRPYPVRNPVAPRPAAMHLPPGEPTPASGPRRPRGRFGRPGDRQFRDRLDGRAPAGREARAHHG